MATAETPHVVFTLASPQFIFESCTALLFSLTVGPRPGLTTIAGESFDSSEIGSGNIHLEEFDIRNSETVPVPVAAVGLFQVMLTQLKLIRTSDGRQFDIAGISMTTEVTGDDIRAGRATLTINAPQLLIIRVQDLAGQPVANVTVSICISTRDGSLEQVTNEKGEAVCLGIPGHYHVAALLPSNGWRRTDFEIEGNDTGERVVVLRMPSVA